MNTASEIKRSGKTYNYENVKQLISGLIEMEETLEHKHDLLTDIGIGSRHPLIFRACEDLRNELPDSSDNKAGPGSIVASGSSRKKVRDVLPKNRSDEIPTESDLRTELEAVLTTLKDSKQKTFEFKGIVFSLVLVKKFMRECRNLPDLEVSFASNSALSFKWSNGNATINSFTESSRILEAQALKELLK